MNVLDGGSGQVLGGGTGILGGGGSGGGFVGGLLVGSILNGGLGLGRKGDDGCDNARFLALENGISQTQDMIQSQNVLGAISGLNSKFDVVNSGIKSVEVQNLVNTGIVNQNISEVKFQNALNFQSLGKQVSDDGDMTRALINANTIQCLRDALCDSKTTNVVLQGKLDNCHQTYEIQQQINKLTYCLDSFVGKQGDINVALGNTVTNTNTLLNSIAGRLPGLSQG